MNEAPKTAELSSQPMKRRWKGWLIGLVVVIAAATIALLSTAPKPEPVRVWFVRATNEGGVKRLVFEGTNGAAGYVRVSAIVFTGDTSQVKTRIASQPSYDSDDTPASARARFYITLNAPPKEVPYFVQWRVTSLRHNRTGWERFRMGCYNFSVRHHMPRLAACFLTAPTCHYIPSTEIKE